MYRSLAPSTPRKASLGVFAGAVLTCVVAPLVRGASEASD